MTTINDLKNNLGNGFGLRKNKYMLEIPISTIDNSKLNILCQTAGFPERTINTTDIWHKGRKYSVRGETDFGGDYEITVLDDDDMSLRKAFDKWMKKIDNSKPAADANNILGSSFDIFDDVVDEVSDAVSTVSNLANANNSSIIGLFSQSGSIGPGSNYQTDINIWQLSGSGEQIYGYTLQNAYPKSIGSIDFSDSEQDSLSQYTITFAFSEFVPISNSDYGKVTRFFD